MTKTEQEEKKKLLDQAEIEVEELDIHEGGKKTRKTTEQIKKDIEKGKFVYKDGKALTPKQLEKLALKSARKGELLELKSIPPVAGG